MSQPKFVNLDAILDAAAEARRRRGNMHLVSPTTGGPAPPRPPRRVKIPVGRPGGASRARSCGRLGDERSRAGVRDP